jgi:SAM-dependent MidA family methyltransferase
VLSAAQFKEQLRRKIQQSGPIPFSDYMEEVSTFYYSSLRNPVGEHGDFYTSADLDPIFGQLLARQFARWAAEFDDFIIVELGAGKGLLARDILQQRQFRYMILERSAAMRERQQELLRDFNVVWIDKLPDALTGCIFSNEFFDALPVRRVIRRGGVLKEIYVTADFEEIEQDMPQSVELPIVEGHVADISFEAPQWIRRIDASLHRGYHMAIDYGYLRDEFFSHSRGTLMCYWHHQAVEDPYVRIGEQDITAHVNFSDLMDASSLETVLFTSQRDYLIQLGILDEMQKLAMAGDAAAMQRLLRIKKLILPDSMGQRFKVLVQRQSS